MTSSLPSNFCIIVGGQKCGTSTLYAHLSEHSNICPCYKKEPHVFGKEKYILDIDKYKNMWKKKWNGKKHVYAIEASTSYTNFPIRTTAPNHLVARRMYDFKRRSKSNIKCIFIIRDPFSRIESYILKEYIHGKNYKNKNISNYKIDSKYIEFTNYLKIIESYHKYFAKDEFLIIKFEDLILSRKKVLKKCFNFLDLEFEYSGENYHYQDSYKRIAESFKKSSGKKIRKMTLNDVMAWGLSENSKRIIHKRLKVDIRKMSMMHSIDISNWEFNKYY